jgi:hypothetical protein
MATCFVDRFLTSTDQELPLLGRYDEDRGYSVHHNGLPVVELPRGETDEKTRTSPEREDQPERDDKPLPPERKEREDVEIEVVRTFVEREDDELRNWATIVSRSRTETAADQEVPDRDYWY